MHFVHVIKKYILYMWPQNTICTYDCKIYLVYVTTKYNMYMWPQNTFCTCTCDHKIHNLYMWPQNTFCTCEHKIHSVQLTAKYTLYISQKSTFCALGPLLTNVWFADIYVSTEFHIALEWKHFFTGNLVPFHDTNMSTKHINVRFFYRL